MTFPPLRMIADPAMLSAFDPAILHALLDPYRDILMAVGYTLPKRRGDPIAVNALAETLQQAARPLPVSLAEALHAITEIGVHVFWPAIQRMARDAGTNLGRLAQPHVTPLDLTARLWLRDPDLVRRLQAEAVIPTVWRFDRWRCDPEDLPIIRLPLTDRHLAAWEADLDEILSTHRLAQGTRIWIHPAGRLVYILIRHGAALRRASVQQEVGHIRRLLFQPAVTDILRYDPLAGELGIHMEQPSPWLSDALRATCSAWMCQEPHLFTRAEAAGQRLPSGPRTLHGNRMERRAILVRFVAVTWAADDGPSERMHHGDGDAAPCASGMRDTASGISPFLPHDAVMPVRPASA